jgi:predicted transposase YdaD
MTKPADVSTKRLISLAPNNWARWVTQIPDITAGEILNSEFQWITRQSDVLISVQSPQYGDFLLLNEIQLRYKSNLPRRIRSYTALAEEKYNLLVYPVLINILKNSDTTIPTKYASNIAGLQARQDYRVINLWEIDVNIAFQQQLTSLLPFVPILKGGEDESTIREALRILRTDNQLEELETVLAFFATFVIDSALVQDIMRWDMSVLRESPWYQEILTEGELRGEARGEARGRQEQALSNIETMLRVKFGSDGLQLMPQIAQISDLERLNDIIQNILRVNTVEELQQAL